MAQITWTQVPTTKTITLPTGNTYYVKDDEVRQWIGDGSTSGAEKRLSDAEAEIAKLSNATHWLGITTTSLTDGSTTNPITINGQSVTAVNGDIVQDSNGQEFIFNGTSWQAFGGSIGTLKAFAYADTGDVTIKPKGTNSSSSVTFAGGSTDEFVKSYSGVSSKLVTDTVPNVTNVGTQASWTATVENENLTFSWTPNTLPTLGTAKTVATGAVDGSGAGATVMTGLGEATKASAVTGIGTATATAQTFTGTQETLTVTPTPSV